MNTRNWIILHHTASLANDTTHQFDAVKRYHIAKGWGDIAYHWFIERDGTITPGRPETDAGAHCYQWLMNYRSIGICLAGDFDVQNPPPVQWDALRRLLTDVQLRNGIHNGRIKLHRDFATYKSCPGTNITQEKVDQLIFSRKLVITTPSQPDITP